MAEGFDVVIVDRSDHGKLEGRETFLADINDRIAMFELAAHVDGVIHLAAVLGTQETVANPGPAAQTNLIGGINVLDACSQYKIPFVYAGVGNYWMRNTYSTTKTALERLVEQYRDELGLSAAVIRPVNAYGPRQRVATPFGPGKVRKIFPAFACRALAGVPIEIYGDGTQISAMVHVRDVATVFVRALDRLVSGDFLSHPIEVGPSGPESVLTVAETIRDLAKPFNESQAVEIVHLPMRPGEMDEPLVAEENIFRLQEFADTILSPPETWRLREVLRTLGTRVHSMVESLEQVGMSARDLTSFDVGAEETVRWFDSNRGVTWDSPFPISNTVDTTLVPPYPPTASTA